MLNLGTATLLVGFNRPELIEKRLAEISKFSNLKLYISIDGPRKKSNDAKANNEILKIIEKWKTKLDIVEIIHKKNIGLALNITSSIENVLESNESIFVIEDDVSVSKQAYNAILRMQKLAHSNVATIGGFGFTNGKFLNSKLSMKNAFRETPYFSAWGWCIDRNTFSNYVLDLSSIKIAKELRDSKIWNMLDAREREIWIRRFDRVLKDPFHTWDLQMQFMSFKYEKTHYLPLFRIIENEGKKALGYFKYSPPTASDTDPTTLDMNMSVHLLASDEFKDYENLEDERKKEDILKIKNILIDSEEYIKKYGCVGLFCFQGEKLNSIYDLEFIKEFIK